MKKLAIITTHPIQYNAPLFKQLAENRKVEIKVFYTWGKEAFENKFDPGFNKIIKWDIPLLESYEYVFLKNISKVPGSHHYKGVVNPDLINKIWEWKADGILVYGWSFKSHLKAMKYFHKKIPVFFRGDSTLLDERKGSIKNLFRSASLKWIYKNIDVAFYTGEANKDYFKKFGLKEKQLVFAPHAVDNKRFETSSQNLRQKLNIPEESIVFLFCGKFEDKKNPKILLEAFQKIKSEDIFLLLVGNGKLELELKEIVKKFSTVMQNKILFLDFQNQSRMPEIYKSADVFVLPSSGPGETWGLSVNEAMASSLPVLVSDKCGCSWDLVHENVNGFVFHANDIHSLTDKLNRFLKSKNELKQMGYESKKIIADWSIDRVSKAIEDTLITQLT